MTGGFIGGIIALVIILIAAIRGAAARRERIQTRERLRLEVDPQLTYFVAHDAVHKRHILELQIPHASVLQPGWVLYGLEEELVKVYKRPSSLLSAVHVSLSTPAQLIINGAHVVGGLDEIFEVVLPGYVGQVRAGAQTHDVQWIGVALDDKHMAWRWQSDKKLSLEAIDALVRTCHRALLTTPICHNSTLVYHGILTCGLGPTTAARMALRALLREPVEVYSFEIIEDVRQFLARWPLWGLVTVASEDARLLDLMDAATWHAALASDAEDLDRAEHTDHPPGAEQLGQLIVMLLGRAAPGEPRQRMTDAIGRHTLTRLNQRYDPAALRKLSKGVGNDPEDVARFNAATLVALDQLTQPEVIASWSIARPDARIIPLLDLLTRHGDAQTMRWLVDAERRIDPRAAALRAALQGTLEQLHKRGKGRDDPTAGALFLAAEPQDHGALTLADDPRGALTQSPEQDEA